MTKLESEIESLSKQLNKTLQQLNFAELEELAGDLSAQVTKPDFWQNNPEAQHISQKQARLERRLSPWRNLKQDTQELLELAKLDDDSLEKDLVVQMDKVKQKMDSLKEQAKLSGRYDDHNAILTLSAGAGGTDAQDWTSMLERMYLRWAENNSLNTNIIQETTGDEAGVKQAVIEIIGDFAYGKLKSEHGVHRLVRQSPFNSAASRETSFAKVEIVPKIDEPGELAVDDKDLKVDVYRSGGHGGQSVNTTDSAVRITHLPTGLTVAIQNERSQQQNREMALAILRSKLTQMRLEQHAEKLADLKPATGANEFGSQIRNYVLHPYKQVKDLRTDYTSSDPDAVLGGELDGFIEAYLDYTLKG